MSWPCVGLLLVTFNMFANIAILQFSLKIYSNSCSSILIKQHLGSLGWIYFYRNQKELFL